MHDRFAHRVKTVRSRPRRVVWLAVLVTILAGVVVYAVGFSPVFVLKDVEVTGGPSGVVAAAETNAEAPFGRPLARVDLASMADRVSGDTRIESVDVSRNWPSSLSIELVMRTPAAVLKQPGKPLRLLDASGVVYEDVSVAPQGLPEITAARGSVEPASLAGALSARSALGEPFIDEVSGINVTTDGDLRFTVGAIDVEWGRPDRAQLKAAATNALLAQDTIDPQGETPMTIDVTAPQTPVVTGLPLAPRD